MFPSSNEINQAKSPAQIRQADDDSLYENGNYKYTTLINRSDSDVSSQKEDDEFVNNKIDQKYLSENKMVKSSSDQKIPETAKNQQYIYVNKNGLPIQSRVIPSKTSNNEKSKTNSNPAPLVCTDLLLEVYKTNKENLTSDERKLKSDNISGQDCQSGRSVPNHELDPSLASLNLSSSSLVQRDANGNIIINTSLAIQEPCSDFNSDHVKYINLFSILCCWCFPITGILGIFFARLTKKYYEMRDIAKAKKNLNRAEWMLMLTFFFGCTIIAVLFALMEFYWFKTGPNSESVNRRISGNIFHARSLPK
ncbi:unnamed protein product [Brachionus calyciflorus]|uniref:Uncharacterized protein n=1 Tax=Brachionus calyciflorus TaxID=104777 RepID=A0A813Q8D9_9BILA|nr:unnamed protein product [Brachionus calyciflorus]